MQTESVITIIVVVAIFVTALGVGYYSEIYRTNLAEEVPIVNIPATRPIAPSTTTPVATTSVATPEPVNVFGLKSPAFIDGGVIPEKYTCDVTSPVSPPLSIRNIPEGTKTLVLVMDDPDIPDSIKTKNNITKFDHWSLYGIPANTSEIPEGYATGKVGLNGSGKPSYAAPCPPKDLEPAEHRYHFRVYASPQTVDFLKPPTLDALENVVKADALGMAELIGRYKRK